MQAKPKISLVFSPQVLEWVESTRASWDPPISRSGFIEACVQAVIEIQDRRADLLGKDDARALAAKTSIEHGEIPELVDLEALVAAMKRRTLSVEAEER